MDIEQTQFQKQVDDLLNKEKVARLNNDANELTRILKQIVQLSFDCKDFNYLFEIIPALSKKRGQSKKAQIEMVQLCMTFIQKLEKIDDKIRLIETLKEVCSKKIFLEVEYARCCLQLVKHKENENEIIEAAKILQEVQVETYGSMDKREKIEFILYQMKIMIKKKDYVRLLIISKKITPKNLDEKELLDLKILFYSYLVEYYNHELKYLEAAQCYQSLFDTLVKNPQLSQTLPKEIDFGFNIEQKNILENYVMYAIIAKYSDEQINMLNILKQQYFNELERCSHLNNIVNQILLKELINTNPNSYNLNELQIFSNKIEFSNKHKDAFSKQLIQHNIRVIQYYYQQIRLNRLAELLNVSVEKAEDELCEMINEKQVTCKIDRIDGKIVFQLRRHENVLLNEWNFDINRVLDLIDKTSNLITREEEENIQNDKQIQQM